MQAGRTTRKALTLVEIMIAVALFAIIFWPVTESIFRSTRISQEYQHEVTAELIGKNIMQQILETVEFTKVTVDSLKIGPKGDANMDVQLDMSGVEFDSSNGYKSPSIIRGIKDNVIFEWRLEIFDINAKDITFTYYVTDPRSYEGTNWDIKKSVAAHPQSWIKRKEIVDICADDLVRPPAKGQPILKTIVLEIRWRTTRQEGFAEQDRLVFVTRKARLEDT